MYSILRGRLGAVVLFGVAGVLLPETASAALVKLTASMTLSSDVTTNFRFDRNNIELNCQGHQIIFSSTDAGNNCITEPIATGGTTAPAKCGIMVQNHLGITIRDCHVTGAFEAGIWLKGAVGVSVIGGSTSFAKTHGVFAQNTQNLVVDNFDSMNNGTNGFQFLDVIAGSMRYTWSHENERDGFDDGDPHRWSTTSGSTGLEFLSSSGQYVESFLNGKNGFEVDAAATAHVFYPGTHAYSNSQHGMSVDDSQSMTFLGVRSEWNSAGNGIRFQNADNSLVQDSTFTNNLCDRWQNSDSTGNTWLNNTYNSNCKVESN